MTDKEVAAAIAAINKRLDAQSLYIINEARVCLRHDSERLDA